MWRKVWKRAISSVAFLALAGCVSTTSAPPIVSYTAAQRAKAAAELRVLPSDSVIAEMIGDYKNLRAAVRVK